MRYLLLLGLVSACMGATTFPYTVETQWNTGFAMHDNKLCVAVGSSPTCGWRMEIKFNKDVDSLTPYNVRLGPQSQSNTDTYYIINKGYNKVLAANSEFCPTFNGAVDPNTNEDLAVISATFTNIDRSGDCEKPNQYPKTTTTTTEGTATTETATTAESTATITDATTAEPADSSNTFPISNHWDGGFTTTNCITSDAQLNGWTIRIEFNDTVNSITPHNAVLNPVDQSNSDSFCLDNQSWNGNIVSGGEICINMNGDVDPGNRVTITNIQLTQGGCSATDTDTTTTAAATTTTTTATTTTTTATTTTTTTTTEAETTTDAGTTTVAATTTTESTTASPTTSPDAIDNAYTEVLEKSILFYEAQRSGVLPADNRVPWRGDSFTDDGTDEGVDLAGGWFDAGDHVKFNLPMSWSTTVLALGVVQFKSGYQAAGQLDNVLDSIKWPLDYLLNCWDSENQEYWYQVGDGHADHGQWNRPEDLGWMERPAYKLDVNNPGSDVAGETAAAFAAGYLAFKDSDGTYANTLLDEAKSLFTFAYTYQGKYTPDDGSSVAHDFYYSHSGYQDELCWAAGWLYKATGDNSYLDIQKQLVSTSQQSEFSWDNKNVGCQVLLYEADSSRDDIRTAISGFLQNWRDSVTKTPSCGLAWHVQWGPLRYAANAALIAMMAAELDIDTADNRDWAVSQIDYMLGANEQGRSYVVDFGNNPANRPHHRSSSCDPDHAVECSWNDFNSADPNPSQLTGALVGGPNSDGTFSDDRSNYVTNEVACDYNAGFQSTVAGLVSLESEGAFPDSHTNTCCNTGSMSFCNI